MIKTHKRWNKIHELKHHKTVTDIPNEIIQKYNVRWILKQSIDEELDIGMVQKDHPTNYVKDIKGKTQLYSKDINFCQLNLLNNL